MVCVHLLNRLMFIYFLQEKFFINNGEKRYLQRNLEDSRRRGQSRYYAEFLKSLFFEGFAKPETERSPTARALLGQIKYLNGGLFLEHRIETDNPNIRVSDEAFESLFALFDRYSWNLNDIPGGNDDEISPDVLGYIFEKYINQKAFGAYYTRPEITEYLCEPTIYRLILNRLADGSLAGPERRFETMGDVLLHLDADLCRKLLQILREMSILDPACGSGAFLVAAMKTLINLYAAVIGKIKVLNDTNLTQWLRATERDHPNISYFVKKTIITDNLFGVDVMEEATEIAKLRLFLALVASAESGRPEQLEPLPNIDFNILVGNSLIGLMRIDDAEFDKQKNLFIKPYRDLLKEKNLLIDNYRHATAYGEDLRRMRDGIAALKAEAAPTLNDLLREEFRRLKVQFEQATWDDKKDAEGKPEKRSLTFDDIVALHPFHWGYEFDEIINKRGGFDVILTNPPWEVFQTDEKEFFQQQQGKNAPTIQKNKLRIEDWKKQQAELMKDPVLRKAWLEFASRFPHQLAFFKRSPQFANQTSRVNDQVVGNKPNLYCLFVEQTFNLLRKGGECGIVVPSGIYTDLGTKQLRELLFSHTQIAGLFCFENRKAIFENVDSRFKFCVLTFEKGGRTSKFPSAFMRHNVEELTAFPKDGALNIPVEFIRHLSPDSLSIPEFKSSVEIEISEKMLKQPLLADSAFGWGLELYGEELNMTRSSGYFKN
ncbi:MAG: DNA methyltransferase [Blastocatellia bacterium]